MSLTDDWKAGKLDKDFYWVKVKCGAITPMQYYIVEGENGEIIKTFGRQGSYEVREVLAPCDYEELQHDKAAYKALCTKWLRLKSENDILRSILKECKEFLYMYPTSEKDFKYLYRKVVQALEDD